MIKICENCGNKIERKEHYFRITEFIDGKEYKNKFVHKKCQDEYDRRLKESLSTNLMARDMLRNLKEYSKSLGIPEVVEIK